MTTRTRNRRPLLTPPQVNLALGLLITLALVTGLASWALPDSTNGWATRAHAVCGLTIVILAPSKLNGPIRTGMRRRSTTKWLSVVFGAVVVATIAFGMVHASGAAQGVGTWSPLWTHELLGFSLIPFALVHVATRLRRRPVAPLSSLGRRALLRFGGAAAVASGAFVVQRALPPLLTEARRRPTGSYEVGSHQPDQLPSVYWINDRRPDDTDASRWDLTIQGRPVAIDDLWAMAIPLTAILDCTGGWWSEHHWDAVPLSLLVTRPTGRSIRVRSATGYARWYGHDELDKVYLAVGYGSEPLRPGHGAPVRLVIPGRRGPEWVKWVTDISDDRRPAWASSPLPLA